MSFSRRHFVIGAAGLGLGAYAVRPSAKGKNYSPYFLQLNKELQQASITTPRLIIDKDKLDHNISAFKKLLPLSQTRRIVAKSLPSVPLLQYICEQTETNKLMLFHLPFLQGITKQMPQSDVLMGKPLPVIAARKFYDGIGKSSFSPASQLQWLIDNNTRLQEYLALAKQRNLTLNINLEIDVGLHRGGYESLPQFEAALALIKNNPQHLTFSGLMGYDAHVGKIPGILQGKQDSYADSQALYLQYIVQAEKQLNIHRDSLCLNGAGSPTLGYHAKTSVANEFSGGSCLIKPSDFDLDSLQNFVPASFIATPVLKKLLGVNLPGAEFFRHGWRYLNPNQAQTFFIYGGNWMADPHSPEGLSKNGLYGKSSNQEMLNGSSVINIDSGDFVFFRPRQSEQVLLQFGEIILFQKSPQAGSGNETETETETETDFQLQYFPVLKNATAS